MDLHLHRASDGPENPLDGREHTLAERCAIREDPDRLAAMLHQAVGGEAGVLPIHGTRLRIVARVGRAEVRMHGARVPDDPQATLSGDERLKTVEDLRRPSGDRTAGERGTLPRLLVDDPVEREDRYIPDVGPVRLRTELRH